MKLIQNLILLIWFCKLVSCSGHFTVIGSKYLLKDENYTVVITSQNFNDLEVPILEAAIHDRNSNWRTARNVTLTNGKPKNVTFNMTGEPIGATGDYIFSVLSVKGVQFNYSVKLNYTSNVAVIVTTDKAIYKANDIVKFRVLVLNNSLKPLNETDVQIFVNDSAQNRVEQFQSNDTSFSKGVYQGDFKLSDSPVLGNWHIGVLVRNKIEAVMAFEVAEYTLPTFKINVKRHVKFSEKNITVTLLTKFGKMAQGNATVTAEVGIHTKTKTMSSANGTMSVNFHIEDDLGIKQRSQDSIVKLFVSFTDELTGKKQHTTGHVEVHASPYKLLMRNKPKKFKPGLGLTLEAQVRDQEGDKPITDLINPVRFIVRKKDNGTCRYLQNATGSVTQIEDVSFHKVCTAFSIIEEEIQCYPTNGVAKIRTTVRENISAVNVTVKYLDAEISHIKYFKAPSKTNHYIVITSKTETPKLRENVRINIESVQNFTKFSYHVLTVNGRVLLSDTIQVMSTQNHDFEFFPADEMDIDVTVIVFYVTDDGETVYDSLYLEFGELKNFVDIQIKSNTKVVHPSQNIDIRITSHPNSFVGLAAIDQSVLTLKSGNYINDSLLDINEEAKSSEPVFFITYPVSDGFTFFSEGKQSRRSHNSLGMDDIEFITYPGSDNFTFFSGHARHSDQFLSTDGEDIEIRKEFSETCLFEGVNFDMNETEVYISWKVPDTITSWKIYGFSINPKTGLAITEKPTELKVFKKMFIAMDLPHSIKRNEIISIPITAFNYMESDQDVSITMYNEQMDFEFIDDIKNENKSTKELSVMAMSGSSTALRIRALRIGFINITVVASSLLSDGDGIERYLLVKPEGITEYVNKTIFIDHRNISEDDQFISISIPSNVVPDSIRVKASIIGDVLGLLDGSVSAIINRPGETGDQNISHVAPHIATLDYLTTVDKLTPEIKKRETGHLRIGYQKQLNYKQDDGSFSMWGKSDKPSSTWLTAFVANSFRKASKYIFVDSAVIEGALQFLSQKQAEDGSFTEVGYMPQIDIRGGSSNKIALTAYILITFLENTDAVATFKNTIDKSLAFLRQNFHNITDNYSLAIATYALQLAHSDDVSLKNTLLTKLEDKAIKEGETTCWKGGDVSESQENVYDKVNSLDIKATAYALHAYVEADRLMDSARIMKWLVLRNEYGGFLSTQDTVVVLQAMSKVAAKMYSPNTDMKVTVKYGDTTSESKSFFVSETNALMLLTKDLPASASDFKITAKGNGFSIFQISYQYNIDNTPVQGIFEISKDVYTTNNSSIYRLHVCTNYTQPEKEIRPNVVLMEVEFPSGCLLHEKLTDTKKIESREGIKKVKNNWTSVIVYFNELNICLDFYFETKLNMYDQHRASIRVSDYENLSSFLTDNEKLENLIELFSLQNGGPKSGIK